MATTQTTISRAQWNRTHADYKTGNPQAGTAAVLMMTDRGTCLVPVVVA